MEWYSAVRALAPTYARGEQIANPTSKPCVSFAMESRARTRVCFTVVSSHLYGRPAPPVE